MPPGLREQPDRIQGTGDPLEPLACSDMPMIPVQHPIPVQERSRTAEARGRSGDGPRSDPADGTGSSIPGSISWPSVAQTADRITSRLTTTLPGFRRWSKQAPAPGHDPLQQTARPDFHPSPGSPGTAGPREQRTLPAAPRTRPARAGAAPQPPPSPSLRRPLHRSRIRMSRHRKRTHSRMSQKTSSRPPAFAKQDCASPSTTHCRMFTAIEPQPPATVRNIPRSSQRARIVLAVKPPSALDHRPEVEIPVRRLPFRTSAHPGCAVPAQPVRSPTAERPR